MIINYLLHIIVVKAYKAFKPDQVLAERMERLFLVMPKYLKYNGLSLDVLHKGFSHLDCNLEESISFCQKWHRFINVPHLMFCIFSVYILYVVETQRGSPACVLQWLGGERLIMAMDEAKTE